MWGPQAPRYSMEPMYVWSCLSPDGRASPGPSRAALFPTSQNVGLSIAFCSVCPLSTQQARREPVPRGGKLGWGLVAKLAYGGGGEAGAQGSEEGCEEGCREGVGGSRDVLPKHWI